MNVKPEVTALSPAWLVPSDRYGWSAVLRNVLPFFLLLWFIPLAADASPYAPWLLTPLLGLLIYRISVVMHDCVHHTLFKNRHLNSRIGLLLGAMTGIDFQQFSRQHWLHHRIYGKPDDPQRNLWRIIRSGEVFVDAAVQAMIWSLSVGLAGIRSWRLSRSSQRQPSAFSSASFAALRNTERLA
jgi:fatty acid desaturase